MESDYFGLEFQNMQMMWVCTPAAVTKASAPQLQLLPQRLHHDDSVKRKHSFSNHLCLFTAHKMGKKDCFHLIWGPWIIFNMSGISACTPLSVFPMFCSSINISEMQYHFGASINQHESYESHHISPSETAALKPIFLTFSLQFSTAWACLFFVFSEWFNIYWIRFPSFDLPVTWTFIFTFHSFHGTHT